MNTIALLKKNLEASILAKQQLLADTGYLPLFARVMETVVDR
jgi:hypothetical protein